MLHGGEIAGDEHLGQSRDTEVGLHRNPTGSIQRYAQALRQWRGGHACGPEHSARGDPLGAEQNPISIDGTDRCPGVHFHAQSLKLLSRFFRERFRKRGKHAGSGFQQQHAGRMQINAAEFVSKRVASNLGQGSGEFHPGRPGADDGEGEPGRLRRRIRLHLGTFEGRQDASANGQRIVEGFQPRREAGPVVMPEVGMRGTGGQHQVIVVMCLALGIDHPLARGFDHARFSHQNGDIALPTQDVAQWRGNVRSRQAGCGHLVEQRLEHVVILAIQQSDADRRTGQGTRCPQARETTTDDQDMGKPGIRWHGSGHSFARSRYCAIRLAVATTARVGSVDNRAGARAAGRSP